MPDDDAPEGPEPVLIAASPAEGGALRAALLSTAGRAPVLVLDRPKAAEPEPIEAFDLGISAPLAQRVAFRPTRVLCTPPPEPLVCVPVRVADCPACSAKAGERCVGIDRWDECHIERLFACPPTERA